MEQENKLKTSVKSLWWIILGLLGIAVLLWLIVFITVFTYEMVVAL